MENPGFGEPSFSDQVPTREPDTVYCPVEFHEESLQFGAF